MSLLQIAPEPRPNQAVSKSKKDMEYHARHGRWAIGTANAHMINRLHEKMAVAERAYNDKVVTPGDIDTFMKDENNNVRNRTMFNFNVMRMLVEQYRGTLIQMQFNATAKPVTKLTALRKQAAMGRHMLMHRMADMGGDEIKRAIKTRYPIGDDAPESLAKFNQHFKDKHHDGINHILQRIHALDGNQQFAGDDGMRFCFSGVLVSKLAIEGSFPRDIRIHPRNFFWDTRAENVDFSDADFLGVHTLRGLSELAEIYALSQGEIKDLDEMLRTYSTMGWRGMLGDTQGVGSALRVHSVYWKDIAWAEFGYVNGPGGVPTLVRVSEDDLGRDPMARRNDLIKPPDNPENRELFGDQLAVSRSYQFTRFAEMIPWEYLVGAGNAFDNKPPEGCGDLVLDYGGYELQEYNPFDPRQSRLPIKAQAFAIADGEIITPIQAAIDPQRYLLRVLSAVENQMNNGGGKGSVVDLDLLDPNTKQADVRRRKKTGDTIFVRAGGRGVQQAIGQYDDTPGQGTYAMLQSVGIVEQLVRTTMGSPEPMTGGQPVKGQGNRTTELVMQRGAVMQEPFYDSYSNWLLQKYRFHATASKQWLCSHPDVLFDFVSDDEYAALMMTDDSELERYDVEITRDAPWEAKADQANAFLDAIMQSGLIPPALYFKLKDTDMDTVRRELQSYHEQLEQAQAENAKQQQAQAAQAGLQAMQDQLDMQKSELDKQRAELTGDLAKIGAQGRSNIEQEVAKAELAPPPAAGKQPVAS